MEYVCTAINSTFTDVCSAAVEVLSVLLHLRSEPVDLSQEQLCKRVVLSRSSLVPELVGLLRKHLRCGTGALLIAQLLDCFCYILCSPHADTTEAGAFSNALTAVACASGPNYFVVPLAPFLLVCVSHQMQGYCITH